jgi:hypothetical protein
MTSHAIGLCEALLPTVADWHHHLVEDCLNHEQLGLESGSRGRGHNRIEFLEGGECCHAASCQKLLSCPSYHPQKRF